MSSIADFVHGWQLHEQCVPAKILDLVCRDPYKAKLSQLKCDILRGPIFEACHKEVDVESYYKRFVYWD